jgi:hypothetical protein
VKRENTTGQYLFQIRFKKTVNKIVTVKVLPVLASKVNEVWKGEPYTPASIGSVIVFQPRSFSKP